MARAKLIGKVEPIKKRWLNKAEAMAYMGVGEDYLTKLRNDSLISFSQSGRMIWYDIESIDRFIIKNKIV